MSSCNHVISCTVITYEFLYVSVIYTQVSVIYAYVTVLGIYILVQAIMWKTFCKHEIVQQSAAHVMEMSTSFSVQLSAFKLF